MLDEIRKFKASCHEMPVGEFCVKAQQLLDEAISALEGQWVSVEERLPEYAEDDNCLIALKGCSSGRIIIRTGHCRKRDDSLWWSDCFEVSNAWDVIAWQPLPALPTMQDDETGPKAGRGK